MRLTNFIEGLQILQRHYKDADGFHIGAEHDQFFAFTTDTAMTAEDVSNMTRLGWFQEEGIDSDGFFVTYEPAEPWTCFT